MWVLWVDSGFGGLYVYISIRAVKNRIFLILYFLGSDWYWGFAWILLGDTIY